MKPSLQRIKNAKIGDCIPYTENNQCIVTQAMKDAVSDSNVRLTGSNAILFAKVQGHLDQQYQVRGDMFFAQVYRDVARSILEAAELNGLQLSNTLQINEYALALKKGSLSVPAAFGMQVRALEDIKEMIEFGHEVLGKALFHGELLQN